MNGVLEKYLKAALYAYPLLETVGEDYDEHIKNKALLSYRNDKTAEELIFYIAQEIVRKERLVWLKETISKILKTLSGGERVLLAIRYFGKERKFKSAVQKKDEWLSGERRYTDWSESKYFRMQNRVAEKVGAALVREGFTKETFENDFAETEVFKEVCRFLERGGDKDVSSRERGWLAAWTRSGNYSRDRIKKLRRS